MSAARSEGNPLGKPNFERSHPKPKSAASEAGGGAKSGGGNRHRAKLDQSRLPAIAMVCIIFV